VSNNNTLKRVNFELPDEMLSVANSLRSAASLSFCKLEAYRDSDQDGEYNNNINNRGYRRLVLPFINSLDYDEDNIEPGKEESYLRVDIEWDSSDGEGDDRPSSVEEDVYLIEEGVQSPSCSATSVRSREQYSDREHHSERSCQSTESSSSTTSRGLTHVQTPSDQQVCMFPYLHEYDNVIATPLPLRAEIPHIIPLNTENDDEISVRVELPPITPLQDAKDMIQEEQVSSKESPTSVMVVTHEMGSNYSCSAKDDDKCDVCFTAADWGVGP